MVRKSKHTVTPKTQLMVAIMSVLLLTALAIIVWQADKGSGWRLVKNIPSYPDVTIKGEAGCLPHRDTDGPQTEECAQGIMTADGAYYAVSGTIDSREQDGTIEVTGTLTPPRNDSKYAVSGVITLK